MKTVCCMSGMSIKEDFFAPGQKENIREIVMKGANSATTKNGLSSASLLIHFARLWVRRCTALLTRGPAMMISLPDALQNGLTL